MAPEARDEIGGESLVIGFFFGLLICYMLGSIPSAYLIGKWVKGIDIRRHGSGNVGAANVFRVVGKFWGFVVLGLDLVKGWVAVFLVAPAFYSWSGMFAQEIFRFLLGFAAIAGHNWTIFLRFHGGKGVATSAGVFLGLLPWAALCGLVVWFLLVLLFRYISVGSMGAALSFPLWVVVFYRDHPQYDFFLWISLFLGVLILYMHRSNIRRLWAGKEPKVTGDLK